MDLQQVNKLSKLFEKVEHGNPSGVDNYLATFGGVVLYNNSKNPPFTPIRDPSTLEKLVRGVRFRLVDSGVKKNTEKAVGIVRQNYEKDGKCTSLVMQIKKWWHRWERCHKK
jgi:mevalonate kinase